MSGSPPSEPAAPKLKLTGKRFWANFDSDDDGIRRSRIIDRPDLPSTIVWVIGKFAYELEIL